jgi:L-lactate dehydrogenase complex protein LldF
MSVTNAKHSELAAAFNKDVARVGWHDETLWWIRQKRDKAAWTLPEWEQLRETASQIKLNTLSNLSEYLTEFEKNALANGAMVHWAADAKEHNEIVHKILQQHKVAQIVKSKSMLTEECGLNDYLAANGVDVVHCAIGKRTPQPYCITLYTLEERRDRRVVSPAFKYTKRKCRPTVFNCGCQNTLT